MLKQARLNKSKISFEITKVFIEWLDLWYMYNISIYIYLCKIERDAISGLEKKNIGCQCVRLKFENSSSESSNWVIFFRR